MDIFKRIDSVENPFSNWREAGHGYFVYPKVEGEIAPWMKFRGRDILNWSMNNYLGFAHQDFIKDKEIESVAKWGLSYPIGTRTLSGHTSIHEKLENMLADLTGKEDAFILNYDYQGMVSLIDTLVTREDVIVYDSQINAALADGLRLHTGKHFVYQHNDVSSLEKQLGHATTLAEKQEGGILLITEGVFDLNGDISPLDQITALKEQFEFRILLDDSRGFLMVGKDGKGTPSLYQANESIDLYYSSFSEALALPGGFVAGEESIINYLRYTMRSQIFSRTIPLPIIDSIINRLSYIETHPELQATFWDKVRYFRKGLLESQLPTGADDSPIISIYLSGSIKQAQALLMDIRESYNLFCSMVTYPIIAEGEIILRFIPTNLHSQEDIDFTISALTHINQNLKEGKYA